MNISAPTTVAVATAPAAAPAPTLETVRGSIFAPVIPGAGAIVNAIEGIAASYGVSSSTWIDRQGIGSTVHYTWTGTSDALSGAQSALRSWHDGRFGSDW